MRHLMNIIENAQDRVFYHATLARNVPEIMKHGLIAQVGERSNRLNEPKAVFLFTSKDAAEDALMSWFSLYFDDENHRLDLEGEDDEEIEFAVFEVTLPPGIEVHRRPDLDWECYVTQNIPPSCLKLVEGMW
jgi:hypothetical protein